MEKKRNRNTWTEEETVFFLELLKEKKILNILDGKRFKAAEVYKALEKEMQKKGYNKDAMMMKTKWKNLKAEYYKAKKHNNQSGVDPKYCPYFELLDELLGDRPSVSMEGVDSSLTEQVKDNMQQEEQLEKEDIEQENSEQETTEEPESDFPDGVYEVSDDGCLSPALPEGVASTSNATPAKVINCQPPNSRSSRGRSVTPTTRNPTAVLLEVRDSLQDSLVKIAETEKKDDEFIEKLLKGQSELLKQMTQDFIQGIALLLKKKRKRHRSSSSESGSEEDKRKKK